MHQPPESKSLLGLMEVLRRLRPHLLHCIAQKAVLYGSVIARVTGARAVIATLFGLGWLFTSGDPDARLGRRLALAGYRRLLRNPHARVLVQNESDRTALEQLAGLDATLVFG
jgi:hypothetical protein